MKENVWKWMFRVCSPAYVQLYRWLGRTKAHLYYDSYEEKKEIGSAKTQNKVAKLKINIFSFSNFLIHVRTTPQPPLLPCTLKKFI